MAIEFSSYFKSLLPATIEQLDNDITIALPELSSTPPDYESGSESYGWCKHVYYNSSTSIVIPNAYVFEYTRNNTVAGASYRLFCVPIYASGSSSTPACYFGAVIKRGSSTSTPTYSFAVGFFTDANLTTEVDSHSMYYSSTTFSSSAYLKVGAGLFKLPGRDDPTIYPHPWDQYLVSVWLLDTNDITKTTLDLKTTSSTSSGHYIEPVNIYTSFIMWDMWKYGQAHSGAGPYQSFFSDYSPQAGPSSNTGGYGGGGHTPSFDDSSDTIAIPSDPTIGVTSVGFVNVYKTVSSALQHMGIELFPDLTYTAPSPISSGSTTDAIVDGFNAIVTFLANIPSFFAQSVASTLVNYIIDCHIIPVTPNVSSNPEYIKVGYKTLSSQGYRVTSDYVTCDCGTINLNEYYTNFADFSATSAKLYLPFVGFVPAQPEWFYRDALNVIYKFNVIDGSFMAYVLSTGTYVNNGNQNGTILAQYSGNACVHLPITGVTYSNMVSGLIGAGAGAVHSAGTGNVAGVVTSALNASTLKGDMPASNSYTASGSFLGVRRPFLLIERSVSDFSKTYSKELGIPSNVSKKLDGVTGFTVIGDVHLDGISATDTEKTEIERLLHDGVIL